MKKNSLLLRIVDRVFWGMASLKFAVFNIAFIAIACAVATVLESIYDTPTAQYYVYRSVPFYLLLFGFGLNILFVAISRWPWRRHHTAFLLAHAGILILLVGSWITYRYGLDGSMRLEEGKQSSLVEIDQPTLIVFEGGQIEEFPIRWTPPNARFQPKRIEKYGITVQEFMTHAEGKVEFSAAPETESGAAPAIRLELEGGPMRIRQEFWLWGGDPGWATAQAGPARLIFVPEGQPLGAAAMQGQGPSFSVTPTAQGDLQYVSQASDGKTRAGRVKASAIVGSQIEPGWAGDLKLRVLEYLPRALAQTVYSSSRTQYGMQAPPSAIRVVAGEGAKQAELWLGLGDRATLEFNGRQVGMAYFPKRVQLNFQLRLDRFQIDHYEGTLDPSEYSSRVTVLDPRVKAGSGDGDSHVISMNEPLVHDGITFYQASYEPGQPRPTVSIFSVNQDPGRWLKYSGSLLLVLGSILLFYQKLKKKGPVRRPDSEASL